MAKSPAQRVRDAEASRRSKGQKEIRVWVPNIPEKIEAVRAFAQDLCDNQDGGHDGTL